MEVKVPPCRDNCSSFSLSLSLSLRSFSIRLFSFYPFTIFRSSAKVNLIPITKQLVSLITASSPLPRLLFLLTFALEGCTMQRQILSKKNCSVLMIFSHFFLARTLRFSRNILQISNFRCSRFSLIISFSNSQILRNILQISNF